MDHTLAMTAPEPTPRRRTSAFPLAPILTFVTVWLGVPTLVVGAWLQPILPGGWVSVLGALALVVIPVTTFVRGLRGELYPDAATRLFVLRPFWYAMLGVPLLAASALVGGLAGWPFGVVGSAGRWAMAITAVGLAIGALAGYVGSRRLVVRSLEADMPRLPATFDGLRVVQLSDLHVGPHTPRRFLRRIVEAVTEARPDLIVFTGDQVDDFVADVEIFNAAFAELDAPHGVAVVAGNHDVYAGWNGVRQGLRAGGYRVLENEAFAVERAGARLWIAGTGDPAGRGGAIAPDVDRTLAGIPTHEPVLALAHNPEVWPALAERGVDLTLSGHTHYGQLAVPRLGWSLVSPFLELAMGVYRHRRSLLYINPGTNYWGVPFRLGTPPEVTVLTLRSADTAAIHDPGQTGMS